MSAVILSSLPLNLCIKVLALQFVLKEMVKAHFVRKAPELGREAAMRGLDELAEALGLDVSWDGKEVMVNRKRIVLAVNKPQGIVCTTEKREKDNIVDFIGYPERIYPMGRLDKDSEGLDTHCPRCKKHSGRPSLCSLRFCNGA